MSMARIAENGGRLESWYSVVREPKISAMKTVRVTLHDLAHRFVDSHRLACLDLERQPEELSFQQGLARVEREPAVLSHKSHHSQGL
jgi:hypothetical protein